MICILQACGSDKVEVFTDIYLGDLYTLLSMHDYLFLCMDEPLAAHLSLLCYNYNFINRFQ